MEGLSLVNLLFDLALVTDLLIANHLRPLLLFLFKSFYVGLHACTDHLYVLLFLLANFSGGAHLLVQVGLHLPLLEFAVLNECILSLILLHLHDAGPVFGQHIGLLVLSVTESVGNLLNNSVILGTARVRLVRLPVEHLGD